MQNGRSLSHDVPLQKASEASAIWDGGDKARTRRGKKARTIGEKKGDAERTIHIARRPIAKSERSEHYMGRRR